MIENNAYVVAYAQGDINNDGIAEQVFLTGVRQPEESFVRNITLVVRNRLTDFSINIPLEENMGYDPSLFLGDFTGNGIKDILISIATGGSGGTYIYYIYSFIHNRAILIFDSQVYNRQYEYEVNYKNDYRVEVVSKANRIKYLIDLSERDPEYLNEIYNDNGILKNPISGWVDPLSGLYPIDRNFDNVYELLGYQQIAGRYHADSLGFVQNTLTWDGHMFSLDFQTVAIFGSQTK